VEVHEKVAKFSNDQPETVGAVAISQSCNDCKKKGHYAGSRFCKGKSFKENVNTVENPSEAHIVWKDNSNYLITVQQISTKIPNAIYLRWARPYNLL